MLLPRIRYGQIEEDLERPAEAIEGEKKQNHVIDEAPGSESDHDVHSGLAHGRRTPAYSCCGIAIGECSLAERV